CPWNVPPASQKCSVAVKVGLENRVRARDVDTARSVNRYTSRTKDTKKRRDCAVRIDSPNCAVTCICNENIPERIHCHGSGVVQTRVRCAPPIARLARRSITSNRTDYPVQAHGPDAMVIAVRNVYGSCLINCDTSGECPLTVAQMQLCLDRRPAIA